MTYTTLLVAVMILSLPFILVIDEAKAGAFRPTSIKDAYLHVERVVLWCVLPGIILTLIYVR